MTGQLEEFKTPELTPEEKAFSAGYYAAEVNWFHMVRRGLTPEAAEEYTSDVAYDVYMEAMTKYFDKEK